MNHIAVKRLLPFSLVLVAAAAFSHWLSAVGAASQAGESDSTIWE